MEKYLNTPIKKIITEFPEVKRALEDYNIGCAPCTLGSCLLKDIVAIHNLPEEKAAELLYRIEKAIYPHRNIKKPVIKKGAKKAAPEEIKYSPPIKRLVDEHALIKKWIGFIPQAIEDMGAGHGSNSQLILDGLNFIRMYADKFHHAKEEDILFEYTEKNLDIIKTILADHETARGHVKAMREAVEVKDKDAIIEHLNAYKDLLTEHIKKEDEILYPWIDRNLSVKQVGELFTKFNAAEEKIDKKIIEKCKRFVEELDERRKS